MNTGIKGWNVLLKNALRGLIHAIPRFVTFADDLNYGNDKAGNYFDEPGLS
jgi:hypothetical protein